MLGWIRARQRTFFFACVAAYILAIAESLLFVRGARVEAALVAAVMAPLAFVLLYVVLGFQLAFNPFFRGWLRSAACAFFVLAGLTLTVGALAFYPFSSEWLSRANAEAAFSVGVVLTAYRFWTRHAAPDSVA